MEMAQASLGPPLCGAGLAASQKLSAEVSAPIPRYSHKEDRPPNGGALHPNCKLQRKQLKQAEAAKHTWVRPKDQKASEGLFVTC